MTAALVALVVGAVAVGVCAGEARRRAAAFHVRRRLPRAHAAGASLAVPVPVADALRRAGVADPRRAVAAWLAAVALAAVLAAVAAGGRIVLALAVLAPPLAVRLAHGRLARRRTAQLPEALDAVAAGLRGGLGLAAAVGGASVVGPPLGPELAAIGREVAGGHALDDALRRWTDAAPDPATTLAGAALAVAATVGGPGARAVDGAAASLRDRLAADAEADGLATQATASAAVLTLAPVAFAVLLTSLDPTAARFLLGSPVGWACIAFGLALDAAGAWWMAALVRRHR
ncbi:MAG: type II secretion system F family protein [Acidimicrobiia bacterium]